jgi:hypothetical protein
MNQQLVDNNYLYVSGFLSAQEAHSLAQEFFVAQQDGKFHLDPQCPSSPAIYNLLPCVKLLVKKVPFVSELLGEDVLPTYTYGRIYTSGEVLNRHRDRDACEISFTVNLQKDEIDWPIWIQNPNGEEVSVNLNSGDAMMYLGCDADHWREAFRGRSCVQLFLHYVRANGNRVYTYFDREKRY